MFIDYLPQVLIEFMDPLNNAPAMLVTINDIINDYIIRIRIMITYVYCIQNVKTCQPNKTLFIRNHCKVLGKLHDL